MRNIYKYSFISNEKYKDIKTILKDTYKVEEYRLWWKGQINEIISFYKQNKDVRNLVDSLRPDEYGNLTGTYTPTFLKLAPVGTQQYNSGGFNQVNNFTIHPSSIATVISRAKSNLIAAKAPIISIQSEKIRETKVLQELVDKIASKNDYGTTLQKDAEYASYSGGVAFKPILDTEFSDIPLYQSYDKGRFFVHKKFDKPIAVVFLDEYTKDRKKYILLSEHGIGYVDYVLVEKSTGKEVPFSLIPELSDLKPIFYFDKETREPIDMLMAVYVENKPGFRSDYENVLDDFQALDETYSKMMDFIRKTSVTRVISEGELPSREDGTRIIPTPYDANILIRYDNSPTDKQPVNELQALPDVDNPIQGFISAMREIQKSIAKTVGLSFKTILGEDLGGANQSGEALSIRENVDFRTRENMVVSWSEAISKLYKLLVVLSTIDIEKGNGYVDNLDEIEIKVELYNPSTPTFEQEVEEVNKLIEYGLLDRKNALYRLWVDTNRKNKEEVDEILLSIQKENKIDQESMDNEKKSIEEEKIKIEEEEEIEEDKEGEEDVE